MAIAPIGTRVYAMPDGTVNIVSPKVEYKKPIDAMEIHGVRNIDIHFPLDGILNADINLFVVPRAVYSEIKANYEIKVLWPIDSKEREIKEIFFTDGTSWYKS